MFNELKTRSKLDNFISGVISAFDISGGSDEIPDYTHGFERDGAALAGDWQRIGGDFRRAMDKVAAGE